MIGLIFFYRSLLSEKGPDIITVVSTIFSLIGYLTTSLELVFRKTTNSHKYKKVSWKNFEKFPLDLKLYLLNPFIIQCFKFSNN